MPCCKSNILYQQWYCKEKTGKTRLRCFPCWRKEREAQFMNFLQIYCVFKRTSREGIEFKNITCFHLKGWASIYFSQHDFLNSMVNYKTGIPFISTLWLFLIWIDVLINLILCSQTAINITNNSDYSTPHSSILPTKQSLIWNIKAKYSFFRHISIE